MSKTDKITLVCARFSGELFLPDNKLGRCDRCRRRVQYRPHAQADILCCMDCAIDTIEPGANVKVTVPKRMVEDFEAYLRKKRH